MNTLHSMFLLAVFAVVHYIRKEHSAEAFLCNKFSHGGKIVVTDLSKRNPGRFRVLQCVNKKEAHKCRSEVSSISVQTNTGRGKKHVLALQTFLQHFRLAARSINKSLTSN